MRRTVLHLPKLSEDQEQVNFFRWLRVTRYDGKLLSNFYYHIPNGGSRHPLEAVKLKNMGVTPGIPDVHGMIPHGPYHSHYIELKSIGGRLTDSQKAMHEILRAQGHRVDVAYGGIEAGQCVQRYLGLIDEKVTT